MKTEIITRCKITFDEDELDIFDSSKTIIGKVIDRMDEHGLTTIECNNPDYGGTHKISLTGMKLFKDVLEYLPFLTEIY